MALMRVIAMLLVTATIALGQSVTLTWDASPTPYVAGYRLYASTNGAPVSNAVVKVDTGTNRVVTVDGLKPGAWRFAATAYAPTTNYDGSVVMEESEPSGECVVRVPSAPKNMATLAVQWIGTLASTNWTDIGFFRLKIGTP